MKACVTDNDPEVKQVKVLRTKAATSTDMLTHLESTTSSWSKMKRFVAFLILWRFPTKVVTVSVLHQAEIIIIKLLQKRSFPSELQSLSCADVPVQTKKISKLRQLDPFLDSEGLLRVGGRLRRSSMSVSKRHPVLLPRQSHVTKLIIKWCHENVEHGGRGMTLNELRKHGFWVINGYSQVRFYIMKCVKCIRLRGRVQQQKMADLPVDRTEEAPPFTYCAVDMFGPFIIKEGRKEMKRYGALFTCLASRAVHLESTNTMDTDSFIQCLRRFIGRRGPFRTIRCDNGTNFVGAKNELQKSMEELDQDTITKFLLSLGADWMISWRHNPPAASHFGGVWERQIRTAHSILSSLMMTHGHSLNYESFRTLLTEVEAIINSRPLTVETISDVNSPLPLSPMNLLTSKSNVVLPPPGVFQKADLYCRRRWRRVQHICNEFWSRWRKEYLQSLQSRNLTQGDIVLIKENDAVRSSWSMGLVTKCFVDDKGCVRSVELRTKQTTLGRPITKDVVVVEFDDSPTRSH